MSYINDLRVALSDGARAKETSRAAGAGMWANYVRSTCWPQTPASVEGLESVHKEVVAELNSLRELTKDEKNSLRSAKSVVAKAITNNVDVWQRDEHGAVIVDEDGNPMPKGKSDLQEAMTDFQRLVKLLDQFEKTFAKDTREALLGEELETLKGKMITLAAMVGEEYVRVCE